MKLLGKDKHGNEYYLASDLYVYQFKDGKSKGWFCSYPAWERTLNNILIN